MFMTESFRVSSILHAIVTSDHSFAFLKEQDFLERSPLFWNETPSNFRTLFNGNHVKIISAAFTLSHLMTVFDVSIDIKVACFCARSSYNWFIFCRIAWMWPAILSCRHTIWIFKPTTTNHMKNIEEPYGTYNYVSATENLGCSRHILGSQFLLQKMAYWTLHYDALCTSVVPKTWFPVLSPRGAINFFSKYLQPCRDKSKRALISLKRRKHKPGITM